MSNAPVTTPKSMIERQLTAEDVGARGFLKWLKVSMPAVYRGIERDLKRLNIEAQSKAVSGLGSFGESQVSYVPFVGAEQTVQLPGGSAPASSSWTDSISKLVSAWGQYKLTDAQLDTVRKITDANLRRAEQGLSPLPYDASQLGLAPTVNVGLSGSTGDIVKYGLIGGGLLILANMFMRRRRA